MSEADVARKNRWMKRRLIVWVGGGLILLVAGLAYREYWLARPMGSGPAGPVVASEPFEKTWTDRPVLLLGIGDSITAGLGADSADHTFFARLIENPADEHDDMRGLCLSRVLPNLSSSNVARSGSTSLYHLDVIENLPTQEETTIGLVVMTTGGNDLIHNYGRTAPREGAMYGATLQQAAPWITNFETRLNRMLDLLDEKFPGGCHIFLADIYDPTDGVGDAPSVFLPDWPAGLAIHGKYNEVIRRCAKARANVHLVPLHETFLGHGSHCRQFWRDVYRSDDPHYWFYSNIEDPNDRGYDAIRRVFLNEIVKVSKDLKTEN